MAVAQEFADAVKTKNVLLVRIMLKDSLLLDKTFRQFNEMCNYAKNQGLNFWADEDEELKIAPRPWNINLMNLELTKLVNDFTERRTFYVRNIIREVYGIPINNNSSVNTKAKQSESYRRINSSRLGNNTGDYNTILDKVFAINETLNSNKKADGSRIWLTRDVDKIKYLAEEIVKACNNIQRRN